MSGPAEGAERRAEETARAAALIRAWIGEEPHGWGPGSARFDSFLDTAAAINGPTTVYLKSGRLAAAPKSAESGH
jgi:hypothetical protein